MSQNIDERVRRLASYPQAMQAFVQTAHALRRPLTEVTAEDVESWRE